MHSQRPSRLPSPTDKRHNNERPPRHGLKIHRFHAMSAITAVTPLWATDATVLRSRLRSTQSSIALWATRVIATRPSQSLVVVHRPVGGPHLRRASPHAGVGRPQDHSAAKPPYFSVLSADLLAGAPLRSDVESPCRDATRRPRLVACLRVGRGVSWLYAGRACVIPLALRRRSGQLAIHDWCGGRNCAKTLALGLRSDRVSIHIHLTHSIQGAKRRARMRLKLSRPRLQRTNTGQGETMQPRSNMLSVYSSAAQ